MKMALQSGFYTFFHLFLKEMKKMERRFYKK